MKRSSLTAAVYRYVNSGYYTENMVLDALGLRFKVNKAKSLAHLPSPSRVIDGFNLYSADQVTALRIALLPGAYFNHWAYRFITGEFLPKGWVFRGQRLFRKSSKRRRHVS